MSANNQITIEDIVNGKVLLVTAEISEDPRTPSVRKLSLTVLDRDGQYVNIVQVRDKHSQHWDGVADMLYHVSGHMLIVYVSKSKIIIANRTEVAPLASQKSRMNHFIRLQNNWVLPE